MPTDDRREKAPDLVRDTLAEARSDRPSDPRHVLERLLDWRERTHQLFDGVQRILGPEYLYDRTGKQQSGEDQVQRVHLAENEVPALDILRITRPPGELRAVIVPRGLWVIGANGRLDLRVLGPGTRQAQYFLVDKSKPMSGAYNAAWYVVPLSDRLDQRPLTEEWIRHVIGTSA